MDTIAFGTTGLRVSRLSIGTGTHGFGGTSDQTSLGLEKLANLLRQAYDRGINFWDAADGYGSHPHVAKALRGLPRDAVVITTKTMSRTAEQATQDVDRYLRELDTDVLDIVLLHFVSQPDWPERCAGAMEALARAKEQGKVRAVGISSHGLGALRTAAETDWVDVVLTRINHDGVNMGAPPSLVVPAIERIYCTAKAVYGMKVLGCGKLAQDPRAAIEYVLQLGTVHAITIGMTGSLHLDQNVRLVEELAPRYSVRALAGVPF